MIHNYDNSHKMLGAVALIAARRPVRHSTQLSVEVIRDDARFFALQEQWGAALAESSASVYQTHEWLSLWWKHFRTPDCSLFIHVVRRSHRILAIVPLFIQARRFLGFRICRRLKLMGDCIAISKQRGRYAEDGPSDYLDIIVAQEEAIPTVIKSIMSFKHLYDEIDFTNIPEQSLLKTAILPALEVGGYECVSHRAQPCPYLETPDSFDEYLQQLPASTRRKFNHARKKFFHDRAYTIEHVQYTGDLVSAFRDLMALHQSRWNRAGYVGLFRDARYERFISEVVDVFHRRGWLWFKSVIMGGTRFAARMGFRFNGQYYDYLSGFDGDAPFAKARPGFALLYSFLEDAVAEKSSKIDFLRGAEPYKFDLTSTVAYNWTFRAVSPEYRKTLSYRLSRVLYAAEDVLHRGMRELVILGIYFREHGMVRFLPKYLGAFAGRLLEKMKQRNSAKKEEQQRFASSKTDSKMPQPRQQEDVPKVLIGDSKQFNVRAE